MPVQEQVLGEVCLETQAEHHFADIGRLYQSGAWPYNVEILLDNEVRGGYAVVLTAHSQFFNSHFQCKGHNSTQVDISGLDITVQGLDHCLEFMKEGFLRIEQNSILDALQASITLGVTELSRLLEEYLCSLSTPIGLLRALEIVFTVPVTFKTRRKIVEKCAEKFMSLFVMSEFKSLNVRALCELLSQHTLELRSEVQVYQAALSWLGAEPDKRTGQSSRVLSCVRFSIMSSKERNLLRQQLSDCPSPFAASIVQSALMRAHWIDVCRRQRHPSFASMEEVPRIMVSMEEIPSTVKQSNDSEAQQESSNLSTATAPSRSGVKPSTFRQPVKRVSLADLQSAKAKNEESASMDDDDFSYIMDQIGSYDRVGSLAVMDKVDSDSDENDSSSSSRCTITNSFIPTKGSSPTSVEILHNRYARELSSTASQNQLVQDELDNYASQLLAVDSYQSKPTSQIDNKPLTGHSSKAVPESRQKNVTNKISSAPETEPSVGGKMRKVSSL